MEALTHVKSNKMVLSASCQVQSKKSWEKKSKISSEFGGYSFQDIGSYLSTNHSLVFFSCYIINKCVFKNTKTPLFVLLNRNQDIKCDF